MTTNELSPFEQTFPRVIGVRIEKTVEGVKDTAENDFDLELNRESKRKGERTGAALRNSIRGLLGYVKKSVDWTPRINPELREKNKEEIRLKVVFQNKSKAYRYGFNNENIKALKERIRWNTTGTNNIATIHELGTLNLTILEKREKSKVAALFLDLLLLDVTFPIKGTLSGIFMIPRELRDSLDCDFIVKYGSTKIPYNDYYRRICKSLGENPMHCVYCGAIISVDGIFLLSNSGWRLMEGSTYVSAVLLTKDRIHHNTLGEAECILSHLICWRCKHSIGRIAMGPDALGKRVFSQTFNFKAVRFVFQEDYNRGFFRDFETFWKTMASIPEGEIELIDVSDAHLRHPAVDMALVNIGLTIIQAIKAYFCDKYGTIEHSAHTNLVYMDQEVPEEEEGDLDLSDRKKVKLETTEDMDS